MRRLRDIGARQGGAATLAPGLAAFALMVSLPTGPAAAQTTTPAAPLTAADAAQLRAQLQALRDQAKTLADQADALERRLDAAMPAPATAPSTVTEPAPAAAIAQIAPPSNAEKTSETKPEKFGDYTFGKGYTLMSNDRGEVNFGLVTYFRYLNQLDLSKTYTDSFGRTFTILRQQNFQLAKGQITLKGWLYNPKFNYLLYVWTANANQGEPAQTVVAGNLNYAFSDKFQLFFGVQSVPTTRSTNRTFPFWLRNDNRTIADEFFRGSYTTGIWAQGTIEPGLQYRVMAANNLSTLGVSASQLAPNIHTFSGAISWMPTTKEYGPALGFGDYEYHDKPATLLEVHYSYSRETAEAQPSANEFENTQLRLSDGTLLFKPDAFNTGGQITKATYQMWDAAGGVKYRGWSLDAEYYARILDNFVTVGFIPIERTFDQGLQLQASKMLIAKRLQAYFSGSKIFGQYGSPYDLGMGFNWFPLKRKELRVNTMALYVSKSPVGYTSYVLPVGGQGWVFTTDLSLVF
jgi:hypothetical protein